MVLKAESELTKANVSLKTYLLYLLIILKTLYVIQSSPLQVKFCTLLICSEWPPLTMSALKCSNVQKTPEFKKSMFF